MTIVHSQLLQEVNLHIGCFIAGEIFKLYGAMCIYCGGMVIGVSIRVTIELSMPMELVLVED